MRAMGPNRRGQARAREKGTFRRTVLYNVPLMQSRVRGQRGGWVGVGAGSDFRRRLKGGSLLPRPMLAEGLRVGRMT